MEFSAFSSSLHAAFRTPGALAQIDNLGVFERVGSTNELGKAVAREYLRDSTPLSPIALVAFEQHAGKGRLGRQWQSERGLGVYCSLVIPVRTQERLQALPMNVGIALASVLDGYSDLPVRLKWPKRLGGGAAQAGRHPDRVAAETGQSRRQMWILRLRWALRSSVLGSTTVTTKRICRCRVRFPCGCWRRTWCRWHG